MMSRKKITLRFVHSDGTTRVTTNLQKDTIGSLHGLLRHALQTGHLLLLSFNADGSKRLPTNGATRLSSLNLKHGQKIWVDTYDNASNTMRMQELYNLIIVFKRLGLNRVPMTFFTILANLLFDVIRSQILHRENGLTFSLVQWLQTHTNQSIHAKRILFQQNRTFKRGNDWSLSKFVQMCRNQKNMLLIVEYLTKGGTKNIAGGFANAPLQGNGSAPGSFIFTLAPEVAQSALKDPDDSNAISCNTQAVFALGRGSASIEGRNDFGLYWKAENAAPAIVSHGYCTYHQGRKSLRLPRVLTQLVGLEVFVIYDEQEPNFPESAMPTPSGADYDSDGDDLDSWD